MSGLIVAVNATVIVAVAVALIVVLGHQRSLQHSTAVRRVHIGRGSAVDNSPVLPPGANPTLAQLLDNFAILRRAQTAADRSWTPHCDCAGAATQLGQYTRLARSLPGGDRLFLDVRRFILGGQENLAAGSFVMKYDVVSPDGNVFSEGFGPNTGFTVTPTAVGHGVYVGVVPDGVSTVTWRFACQRGGNACAGTHPFNLTAAVVGNAAAMRVTKQTCIEPSELTRAQRRNPDSTRRLMTDCDSPAQITWRAAAGQVVATFSLRSGNLPAAPFVKGARPARSLRVLGSAGIGGARIGQSASAAVHSLDQMIGSRTVTRARVPGCQQENEAVWTSPAVASPLTVYERNGRFIGYQYGAPVNEIGLARGPGAVLSTTHGLTLDETVGQARRLYGKAFHAHVISVARSRNGGGIWTADARDGTVTGALLPIRYPMRTVTPANPIATIISGDVGCS